MMTSVGKSAELAAYATPEVRTDSPAYRELLVRWFQWGTFCPVFRLHGYRRRRSSDQAVLKPAADASEAVVSGGPNEVWSYGEEAYRILTPPRRVPSPDTGEEGRSRNRRVEPAPGAWPGEQVPWTRDGTRPLARAAVADGLHPP